MLTELRAQRGANNDNGGCIHGSPSICIGNAFFTLRIEQRALEPPCMLGMLRTAMPSRDRLLRSRGVPEH
ncbi:hypothetical protein EYF80_032568 [Liparis tanakae]|uniref:Uncharacterized protein n=1 Tax=Liparis tanakae TaxID=230148 RepID=A0A4Z2GXA7_9TELE|nr:hypothetical protein EYF80_032568 [Liparis tanakae]